MTNSGTIDITDLVATLKNTWVKWAVTFVITSAKAVPWLAWLRAPIISQLFEFFLTKVIEVIANGLEMESFFLNTAIRKASQAKDYVDAVEALKALPPTTSESEYEKAEQREMAAFRNFVMVTN